MSKGVIVVSFEMATPDSLAEAMDAVRESLQGPATDNMMIYAAIQEKADAVLDVFKDS